MDPIKHGKNTDTLAPVKRNELTKLSKMDPKTIQNKIKRIANNGKLNDFVNSLNWLDGILKNRTIDIRIM